MFISLLYVAHNPFLVGSRVTMFPNFLQNPHLSDLRLTSGTGHSACVMIREAYNKDTERERGGWVGIIF